MGALQANNASKKLRDNIEATNRSAVNRGDRSTNKTTIQIEIEDDKHREIFKNKLFDSLEEKVAYWKRQTKLLMSENSSDEEEAPKHSSNTKFDFKNLKKHTSVILDDDEDEESRKRRILKQIDEEDRKKKYSRGKDRENEKEKELEWERRTKMFLESSDDDTDVFFQKEFFKKGENEESNSFPNDLFDENHNVRLDSLLSDGLTKSRHKKPTPFNDIEIVDLDLDRIKNTKSSSLGKKKTRPIGAATESRIGEDTSDDEEAFNKLLAGATEKRVGEVTSEDDYFDINEYL